MLSHKAKSKEFFGEDRFFLKQRAAALIPVEKSLGEIGL
jgi:hypothetical protein